MDVKKSRLWKCEVRIFAYHDIVGYRRLPIARALIVSGVSAAAPSTQTPEASITSVPSVFRVPTSPFAMLAVDFRARSHWVKELKVFVTKASGGLPARVITNTRKNFILRDENRSFGKWWARQGSNL
jgi:hypothetical protein